MPPQFFVEAFSFGTRKIRRNVHCLRHVPILGVAPGTGNPDASERPVRSRPVVFPQGPQKFVGFALGLGQPPSHFLCPLLQPSSLSVLFHELQRLVRRETIACFANCLDLRSQRA